MPGGGEKPHGWASAWGGGVLAESPNRLHGRQALLMESNSSLHLLRVSPKRDPGFTFSDGLLRDL